MTDLKSGLHAVSRELFITGMRQVASSVAVVTTSGPAGQHGTTVSAFSSVSADPPQLLVCLRSASRIASAVAANGAFCLNILSHRNPHVAERFSGIHDSTVTDRFEGIGLHHEGDRWVVEWEDGDEHDTLKGARHLKKRDAAAEQTGGSKGEEKEKEREREDCGCSRNRRL
jgi:hypothetical protein